MADLPLLVLAALLLLALLSPLKDIWPLDWLAAVMGVLPLAVLCGWLRTRRHDSRHFTLPPGSVALFFLIGWGFLQILPMPPFLVKALSPEAWRLYSESVAIFEPGSWVTLSLNPKSTLRAVLAICGGTALYFLTTFLLTDQQRLKRGVLWLTGIGGGLAIGMVGWRLAVLLAGTRENVTGFLHLDATSFALLLLLLGPLAFSALLALRPSARYGSLQERIVTYWQTSIKEGFLIVFASALIIPFGVGVWHWPFLLFYLGALCLLWILLFSRGKGKKEGPYMILLVVCILMAMAVGFGTAGGLQGLNKEPMTVLAERTLGEALTRDFFRTGSGLGSYDRIHGRYEHLVFDHQAASSENPALQRFRVEGGFPAIIFSLWFCVALIRHSLPLWRRRRNRLAVYIVIGSLTGLLGFLSAILVLGLPSPLWLSYYGLVLAGLMVAASQTSRRWPVNDDFLPVNTHYRLSFILVLSVCILLATLLTYSGAGLARWLTADVQVDRREALYRAEEDHIRGRVLRHASLYDPLEASYRRLLAWHLLEQGQIQESRESFANALGLDPLAGQEAYRIGIHLAETGDGDAAARLMRHALKNDWHNQVLQVDFVARLLRHEGRSPALEHIHGVLAVDPSKTLDWLYFLEQQGFSPMESSRIIVENPRCLIDYGDFLILKSQPELALESYLAALRQVRSGDTFTEQTIWRMSAFFEEQQRYEDALAALLAGVRVYPEDLDFLKASGNLYERLGITFKAAEFYRQILVRSPHDAEIRQRLERLEDVRR